MPLFAEQLTSAAQLASVTFDPITQAQIDAYAEASGDMNPIHRDEAFAQQVGLGGTIAHGMLIMGLAGRYIAELADPQNLRQFGVRFRAMTRPGETIICTSQVDTIFEVDGEQRVRCELQATNQQGDLKLSGYFTARLERISS